jgi:hypothetical protein
VVLDCRPIAAGGSTGPGTDPVDHRNLFAFLDSWVDGSRGIRIVRATLAKMLLPLNDTVLRIDTGCIVGFQKGVDFDIQYVGGIKSALFGGERLFFATLRGPGRVWMQSLPFSRLA